MSVPTPMTFSRLPLILVAVFAAGVALGVVITRSSSSLKQAQAEPVRPESQSARDALPSASVSLASQANFEPVSESGTAGGDLSSTLGSAAREPDPHRRSHRLFEVASNLNARDAANALQMAQALSPAERNEVQPVFLARLLDLEPSTALQWVSAMPLGRDRDTLMNEVFKQLGSKNPDLALNFLNGLKGISRANSSRYRAELFQSWTQRNPQAAAQQALKLESQSDRGLALSVCVQTWARQAPRAAAEWLGQMPPGEMRRHAYQSVFNEWAAEDPEGAANEALSLTDERERNSALVSVVAGVCAKDPKRGRELINQISAGNAQDQALGTALSTLMRHAPAEALEHFDTLPVKRQASYAFALANDYANRDIQGALDWSTKLPTEELRKKTVPLVLQRWAETDPKGAFDYAAAITGDYPGLLSKVVAKWAEQDPRTALARVETLPDPKARESALSQCLSVLALTAPEDAVREANKMSADKRRSTMSGIATTLAKKDPETAANWIMQKADPDLMAAIPTIMKSWALDSPTQAAGWLQRLPTGKTRDSAIASFAGAVRELTPESAADWTLVIGDSQLREKAVRELVADWREFDRKAVINWLRQAPGISEQTRQDLLQESEKR